MLDPVSGKRLKEQALQNCKQLAADMAVFVAGISARIKIAQHQVGDG